VAHDRLRDLLRYAAIVLGLLSYCPAHAAENGVPPTTLSVYQSLAAEALADALGNIRLADSAKAVVAVEPAGTYWFVEEALSRELRYRGVVPVPSNGDLRVGCGVKEARVTYSNARRDGLLGTKLVDRTVAMAMWIRVSDTRSGQYLIDREWQSARTDTVEIDIVARLEHPGVSATHGVMPSEGFFSSWLEPFVVVGAIGVAILLLFTTRS
jgi:hypothetical protein